MAPQNTRGRKKSALNTKGAAAPRRGGEAVPAVVSVESDVESTASIGTNGSVRSKIPPPVLKQLFYDIERAGGIQEFDKGVKQALNLLLDNGDPVIYGYRGDKVRKRLTNKVYQWKKLDREKYLSRLFKLRVQSAESLQKADIVKIVAKKSKKRPSVIPEEEVAEIPDEIAFSPEERQPRPFRQGFFGFATDSDKVRDQILAKAYTNNEANIAKRIRPTEPVEATMKGA